MVAQVSYYRDVLGLRVKEPRDVTDFDTVHWVEFDTGGCTLALHAGGQGRLGEDAPKFVFRVVSVSDARAWLSSLGVTLGEIRSPAPGIEVCDGQDPEGNWFSLESR